MSSLKRGVLMPDVWNGGYKLVGRGFRSPSPCVVFVILVAGVCVRVGAILLVVPLLVSLLPFYSCTGSWMEG